MQAFNYPTVQQVQWVETAINGHVLLYKQNVIQVLELTTSRVLISYSAALSQ